MFLLIDNYDSFTYNLVQAFCRLGHRPRVVKNDDPGLVAMANDPSLRMVCISPGPGHPSKAGYCLDFLRQLSPASRCSACVSGIRSSVSTPERKSCRDLWSCTAGPRR